MGAYHSFRCSGNHSMALILSLLLLLPLPVLAQSDSTTITVLAEEFWPYSFAFDESSEPRGIFIDFAIELITAAGYDYELQLLPWPRVMRRAGSNANQLIITLIRSRDREELVHWVGPVAEVNHALYGQRASAAAPLTLEEARDLVVATVVEDVASLYLESNGFSNLIRTSDHLRGLELLTRGRVDLYPGNTALIDYQCAQLSRGCDNIELVLPLTELEQDLYFALSIDTSEDVVQALRQRFDELVSSGRLEALKQSFLRAYTPQTDRD